MNGFFIDRVTLHKVALVLMGERQRHEGLADELSDPKKVAKQKAKAAELTQLIEDLWSLEEITFEEA